MTIEEREVFQTIVDLSVSKAIEAHIEKCHSQFKTGVSIKTLVVTVLVLAAIMAGVFVRNESQLSELNGWIDLLSKSWF